MNSHPPMEANRLDSHEDIPEFIGWLTDTLGSRRPIALDTETHSFKELWSFRPGPGFCRLWQVGTSESGWAIDSNEWHGLVDHAMRRIVSARGTQVFFANAKYDQHVFVREGWPVIPWPRVHDVLTMHRLARPQRQLHGLKPACVAEFGEWADEGRSLLDQYMAEHGLNWSTIPTDHPMYWGYGCMDTIETVMLGEALAPTCPDWYHVESEYSRLTWGMERRGLRVDPEAVELADAVWTERIEELAVVLRQHGIDKPRSSKAIDAAFKALGFEATEFSARTGDPTYNKMVLKVLTSMGEPYATVAQSLIDYRSAAAWRDNYGKKLLRFLYHGSDTLHPSIKDIFARTGRSSIVDPPLQTIPKKPITRNMFIPRRGEELWAVDYNSQEVRIQAALSGDPGMMAFFKGDDPDYHAYVARLAHIPRPAAKIVNYARAYGAGAEKLAKGAGCSVDEMLGYLAQIDAAFPRAMAWKDEVTAEAEARARECGWPFVVLPYGMVTALEEGKEFTTAANSIIQGHGAAVLKAAACRLAAAGYEEAMVLPVHDELLFSFPKGEGQHHAYECAKIMEDRHLSVPLDCEVTGPLTRWGQACKED